MSKADEIKVIDILNKVANGEEVPKNIRVDGVNYIFDEFEMFYHRDNESKEDLLVLGKEYSAWDFLNWNVEVIEDQTIDIDSIEEIDYTLIDYELTNDELNFLHEMKNGINECVRALKHLNKEIHSIKEK